MWMDLQHNFVDMNRWDYGWQLDTLPSHHRHWHTGQYIAVSHTLGPVCSLDCGHTQGCIQTLVCQRIHWYMYIFPHHWQLYTQHWVHTEGHKEMEVGLVAGSQDLKELLDIQNTIKRAVASKGTPTLNSKIKLNTYNFILEVIHLNIQILVKWMAKENTTAYLLFS